MKNNFLTSIYQRNTTTENGAISNSTSGSSLLDYFSKCGTYRNRSMETVFADMSAMWWECPLHTLQVVFYNRMITRNIQGSYESEKVQMGQGNKDEFRKALIWLAKYQSTALYKNLWIIPMVGYWKVVRDSCEILTINYIRILNWYFNLVKIENTNCN